jgi:hypothetical protein
MVESICGQGFTYTREMEEERLKKSCQTRTKGGYRRDSTAARLKTIFGRLKFVGHRDLLHALLFIRVLAGGGNSKLIEHYRTPGGVR